MGASALLKVHRKMRWTFSREATVWGWAPRPALPARAGVLHDPRENLKVHRILRCTLSDTSGQLVHCRRRGGRQNRRHPLRFAIEGPARYVQEAAL